MFDSVRPPRRQPTRLPRPWDSPGKNTGVRCHFLFQCMKVKVKSLSRVRLSDPMDCSLTGSSVHGIFQARVLEWGAIAFSEIPYICISILYWCFSFWLTSLCIIGSSFIHLIRTDSNVFFFFSIFLKSLRRTGISYP